MTHDTVTTRIDTQIKTRILAGKVLRDQLLVQVRDVVAELQRDGVRPQLCVIQVGHEAASDIYINQKRLACERVGIEFRHERVADDVEERLHETIAALAEDKGVHGILVQTPLPEGWDMQAALDKVPAAKDVDGLAEASKLLRREGEDKALLPATPLGIFRLMHWAGIELRGQKVAMVGQGPVVGAPLAEMLIQRGIDVCIVDKKTPSPESLTRACDVLVTATGVANLITDAWLKPGALVIDAGTTELTVNHTSGGDVDRAKVDNVAGIVTPVPGGVGPVTVASLLTNVVDAACLQVGRPRTAWVIDA